MGIWSHLWQHTKWYKEFDKLEHIKICVYQISHSFMYHYSLISKLIDEWIHLLCDLIHLYMLSNELIFIDLFLIFLSRVWLSLVGWSIVGRANSWHGICSKSFVCCVREPIQIWDFQAHRGCSQHGDWGTSCFYNVFVYFYTSVLIHDIR